MQSKIRFNFFNTIRFKLTLIYSGIILIFALGILLLTNFYLTQRLRIDPFGPPQNSIFGRGLGLKEVIADAERLRVKEIRQNDLNNFQEITTISIVPIFLFSFALGYFVSGRFLKPISDLSIKVKEINSTKLGSKIKYSQNDEVGDLIESFNLMSLNLKDSFDSQLKFVQDAAHELKTPLTIIKTSLESTLNSKNSNLEDYKSSTKDAIEAVDRLNLLTQDLLKLTQPFLLNETIDLKALVDSQLDLLGSLIQNKKIKVEFSKPKESVTIKGNYQELSRAIYNILHNSIKYSSKSDAFIKIELKSRDKKAEITFIDNGIGIAKEHKDKIFKRFYRATKSSSGNGLGLSISKEIIEKHSGSINLIDDPLYTVFRITF